MNKKVNISITVYYFDYNDKLRHAEVPIKISIYNNDDSEAVFDRITDKAIIWASNYGYQFDDWEVSRIKPE